MVSKGPYEVHEHYVIGALMARMHPLVQDMVKKSLQQTLVNMIAHVRDDKQELEQVVDEYVGDENFGSW